MHAEDGTRASINQQCRRARVSARPEGSELKGARLNFNPLVILGARQHQGAGARLQQVLGGEIRRVGNGAEGVTRVESERVVARRLCEQETEAGGIKLAGTPQIHPKNGAGREGHRTRSKRGGLLQIERASQHVG